MSYEGSKYNIIRNKNPNHVFSLTLEYVKVQTKK